MASLLPGTRVQARGLPWEIVSVDPLGDQQRFRLRGLGGALQGYEFEIIHPFEKVIPISEDIAPEKAGRLNDWNLYHDAFLLEQAFGSQAILATQPGRLNLDAYQLVPLLRALELPRSRILLADGVGLGKTIQAGLIISELIARRRAHRILIVTPAGPLLEQWRQEMKARFGLRFRVLNRDSLQALRHENELGANPFDQESLGLISIDFAKQERILTDLERSSFDLVIIDEAHHCVRIGKAEGADREDSLRRRLAEVLARQAEGLLLLTATPHDGYDAHFASLIELLDPSLLTGGLDGRSKLRGNAYQRHVIRRLKTHIKDPETGEDRFKVRKVLAKPVTADKEKHASFAEFHAALLSLVNPRIRAAIRSRRFGEVLAFMSLLKRSVSSVQACLNTLNVVATRYEQLAKEGHEEKTTRQDRLKSLRKMRKQMERYGSLSAEEEEDKATLEAEDLAAEIFNTGADELLTAINQSKLAQSQTAEREKRLEAINQAIAASTKARRRDDRRNKKIAETLAGLKELVDLAKIALPEDPKLEAVVSQIIEIRKAEPKANVLVYTEYTDSQAVLVEALKAAKAVKRLKGKIAEISGKDGEADRIAITERFAKNDNIILVSTDATAEGLNLHERCHHLIHLELPYNPNRLEQRNGRIDRYGQQLDPLVRYLYLRGTFEERVLLRLVAKYEKQRQALTFVPNTLGVIHNEESPLTGRLLDSLSKEDGQFSLFNLSADPVTEALPEDSDDEATQQVLKEIDKSLAQFKKAAVSNQWLGASGLNAGPGRIKEADDAVQAGQQLNRVDLTSFVIKALEREDLSPEEYEQDTWRVRLSGPWVHGLEELPGYDADKQMLRMTTKVNKVVDERERPLGFLGRGHPIVRRTIERVRQRRFGSNDDPIDIRVSAAQGDGPALLVTALCQVESRRGRAFERVLAALIYPNQPDQVFLKHNEWQHLSAHPTETSKGHWKHFEDWGMERIDAALKNIGKAFAEIVAPDFLRHAKRTLDRDEKELTSWLKSRSVDLTGEKIVAEPSLFPDLDGKGERRATWMDSNDPMKRLSGFANDKTPPLRQRLEAETVLSNYTRRREELRQRQGLKVSEAQILGLLMIVPEGQAKP